MKNVLQPKYLQSVNYDTIYVLAPGPNGKEHWKNIPEDAFVIVVNKAIELVYDDKFKYSDCLWLVAELSAQDTVWFPRHKKEYKDILVVGRALIDVGGMREDEYYKMFDYYGSFPNQGTGMVSNCLNSKGTVSCMATQLAFYMGAKKIVLCGVDMFDDKFYDGTFGFYKGMRHNTPWHGHICNFGSIIRQMRMKRNVEIVSLSETKLVDIEVV
jgi:hypothetical protein